MDVKSPTSSDGKLKTTIIKARVCQQSKDDRGVDNVLAGS